MTELKKYLLCKWTQGGWPDKSVGNHGEVEEYGRDQEHAKERAKDKYGGAIYSYTVIGEIVS